MHDDGLTTDAKIEQLEQLIQQHESDCKTLEEVERSWGEMLRESLRKAEGRELSAASGSTFPPSSAGSIGIGKKPAPC